MQHIRRLGVILAAATSLVGLSLATAAASAPSSAALVCFVSGDGVRIHSQPNTSSTVLGLAYSGDNWVELAGSTNTYAHGTDARTGVSGFITWSYLRDCYE
ncbi:hypothetical protein [Streptomyces sp. B21-083]|uniref:hypothetical protein n=1 Tax=Streptomyces sp. B21-083 TaxID=3039410 RepID=UPI002FEF88D1